MSAYFILASFRLHTQSEFEKLEKSYLKLQADYDAERTRVLELERRLSDLRDKGIAINVPLTEGLVKEIIFFHIAIVSNFMHMKLASYKSP